MKKANFIFIFLLCVCFFVLGLLMNKLFFENEILQKERAASEFRSTTGENRFTNPLLDCEGEMTYINPNLERLLKQEVDRLKRNASIEQVSVYFRDLNNGSWFGVNEREKFIFVGLNQVPLMISVFKLIEEYPEIANDKFVFNEATELFTLFVEEQGQNERGMIYNIYDVIEYMIKYAHNNTASFLLNYSMQKDPALIDNVFLELGMKPPSSNELHQLTTKEYASFFRVLYNASYLNRRNSERALAILNQTDFKDGIVKGVGENIVIANKSGFVTDDVLMQLHECGIIYYPSNTYLLCVMVKGYNINEMTKAITSLSAVTYNEIKVQTAK